jgi:hypothetical protein
VGQGKVQGAETTKPPCEVADSVNLWSRVPCEPSKRRLRSKLAELAFASIYRARVDATCRVRRPREEGRRST